MQTGLSTDIKFLEFFLNSVVVQKVCSILVVFSNRNIIYKVCLTRVNDFKDFRLKRTQNDFF